MCAESAKQAIHDSFRLLGIDLGDQKVVNSLRDDFQFVRAARLGVDDAGKIARKAAVTALVGLTLGSFLIGFKEQVKSFLGLG